MTEEEIKHLKKGDTFTVKFVVDDEQGDYVHASFEDGSMYGGTYKNNWDLLKHAVLVQPAPTFEVGDTVRIIPDPLTGHVHNKIAYCDAFLGQEKIITAIDDIGGSATMNNGALVVSIHCLELVKKAKAVKDKYGINIFDKETGRIVAVIFEIETRSEVMFYWRTHPNAEAAAKAECDRLNAEWRKQQEQQ